MAVHPPGPEPSAADLAALRQVRMGRIIDPDMRHHLIDVGLVEQKLGGLGLTTNGQFWDAAKP